MKAPFFIPVVLPIASHFSFYVTKQSQSLVKGILYSSLLDEISRIFMYVPHFTCGDVLKLVTGSELSIFRSQPTNISSILLVKAHDTEPDINNDFVEGFTFFSVFQRNTVDQGLCSVCDPLLNKENLKTGKYYIFLLFQLHAPHYSTYRLSMT